MTAPTEPPLTFTARTPEDVLALVPVVLGFAPEDSVAMLTFGAAHPFHARVDLPEVEGELPAMVEALLAPARHHRVRRAFFVVYTTSERLARRAAHRLADDFEAAGVDVIEVLRADGSRWWPAVGRRPGVPAWGVPYDLSTHPFSAEAVLDGRVLLGSREELRATLLADPAAVARVVAALADRSVEDGPPGRWVADLVRRHCRDGTPVSDAECARLLRALLDVGVRDEACGDLGRATARAHVGFWTDVVRRSPDALVAAPAAVLALAAWQAGHGALAWCALDRCADVDAAYPLARLVEQALLRAVPPQSWEEAG